MSQIILITRFGKKECVPFQVNEAPNNFEPEDLNSISESGEVQAQDQDAEAPENIADD